MLGTVTIIALLALGFNQAPAYFVLPLAIVNNFIGIHTPRRRWLDMKHIGVSYWRFFFTNFPLIALLSFLLYGIGYAASAIYGILG